MNDRGLKVLEQYDLNVLSTRRGRGSYIFETNNGKKLLTEFAGSTRRLAFQNQVLGTLKERGFVNVDCILENKEGSLVSNDRDGNGYIVKDWYEGKECDTKSEEDILIAVGNLARLHQVMVLEEKEFVEDYRGMNLIEELKRHNQEMKKVRSFIRSRRGKNPFESKFLSSFDMFYEQAENTVMRLEQSGYEELYESSVKRGALVHGNYNQHQILIGGNFVATTNFDKCRYDVQVSDLYQFLRKILEKHDFSIPVGMRILEEYSRIKPITAAEREHFMLRLSYPEKFWKLGNQYYNMNKAWMPQKNVDKLEALAKQQDKRNCFLKILE